MGPTISPHINGSRNELGNRLHSCFNDGCSEFGGREEGIGVFGKLREAAAAIDGGAAPPPPPPVPPTGGPRRLAAGGRRGGEPNADRAPPHRRAAPPLRHLQLRQAAAQQRPRPHPADGVSSINRPNASPLRFVPLPLLLCPAPVACACNSSSFTALSA